MLYDSSCLGYVNMAVLLETASLGCCSETQKRGASIPLITAGSTRKACSKMGLSLIVHKS